jgi:sortase A
MKGRNLLVIACSATLLVVACAAPDDTVGSLTLPAEDVATTVASAPVTVAASTTSTSVVVESTTTMPAPTTTAAPTVVETLPVPAPPPEPRADEPYVELGTIEIPALSLAMPMLEGISLTTLDRGPGHWPGTAIPGHLGNVVVAGHRTSHGKVFRHIDQLVPGDEVIFTTPEGRFVYAVTETTVVTPDAMYIIEQTEARTATLFACHPPGSTKQRIVVHLELQTSG